MFGNRLKLQIAAPPVDGKANDEVIDFLAHLLDVPKSTLRIVHGTTGKQKTVAVRGLHSTDALARLAKHSPP